MISNIAERNIVAVRWAMLIAWFLLIAHLLVTAISTAQNHSISAIVGDHCVQVQSHCVLIQSSGNICGLFWGAVIPITILILLVVGHVAWRRICPLSWVSQLPRLLGWQRLDRKGNPIRIKATSWLGRYGSYFQMGFLLVGLCLRLLIINADPGYLALWFLFTIAFAFTIGSLYAGKSWCQYFCPMAPVQKIFAEPIGILSHKAHVQTNPVTQSMCRTSQPQSTLDRSACVACRLSCIDIDAERSYWDGIDRLEMKWLYYGYWGLVVGFFGSFYIYAGNWEYYFSGVWTRESTLIQDLWRSGSYLFPEQFYLPKILILPLVLSSSVLLSYSMGRFSEFLYFHWHQKNRSQVSSVILQHQLYSVWTFISFNTFFLFAGRPFFYQLPQPWHTIANHGLTFIILLLSTFWLIRSLRRSPDRYAHERIVSRWLKSLQTQNINLQTWLKGKSVYSLTWEELLALRTTIVKLNPNRSAQIDRAFLQAFIDDIDHSLTGRAALYRFRLFRKISVVLGSHQLSQRLIFNLTSQHPSFRSKPPLKRLHPRFSSQGRSPLAYAAPEQSSQSSPENLNPKSQKKIA